jgi:hypothetical protein
MNKSELRAAWEEMIQNGELVPNGQMRPGRDGRLEPVYVLSEKGRLLLDELEAKEKGEGR